MQKNIIYWCWSTDDTILSLLLFIRWLHQICGHFDIDNSIESNNNNNCQCCPLLFAMRILPNICDLRGWCIFWEMWNECDWLMVLTQFIPFAQPRIEMLNLPKSVFRFRVNIKGEKKNPNEFNNILPLLPHQPLPSNHLQFQLIIIIS